MPPSVISASSDFGVDGVVDLDSPAVDIAGTMNALPVTFTDPTTRLQPSCGARDGATGTFAVFGRDGLPAAPDGWLAASAASL